MTLAYATCERSVAPIGVEATQGTVLVVDDEPDSRRHARMALEEAGYDVLEANDGEEAIETINRGKNSLLIDVVFTGICMPRIYGVEEIAYFREQFPHVEVIVCTGWPDLQVATTLLKSGVRDFLIKPVTKETILSAVAEAMARRTSDW